MQDNQFKSPNHYLVAIKHQTHQVKDGVECWDIIRSLKLSYNVGNAFAYLWRSLRKGQYKDDVCKAIKHLEDELIWIKESKEGEQSSEIESLEHIESHHFTYVDEKIIWIDASGMPLPLIVGKSLQLDFIGLKEQVGEIIKYDEISDRILVEIQKNSE